MKTYFFLDLETTGLDVDSAEITEIAWLRAFSEPVPERLINEAEYHAFVEHSRLPNKWVLEKTDYATRILPAPKRQLKHVLNELRSWAAISIYLLGVPAQVYLVGANPSLDDAFLRRAYRSFDEDPPYSYHLIDIEAMVMGALGLDSPPSLREIRGLLGIAGANPAPHSALADAREVKLMWDELQKRKAVAV